MTNIKSYGRTNNPSWTPVKMYDHLQILLTYFNYIHQNVLLPTMLYFVGLGVVIGIFALTTHGSAISILQILILATGAIQSSVGIVAIFGTFGVLYCESMETHTCIKANQCSTEMGKGQYKKRKLEGKIVEVIPAIENKNWVRKFC